LTHPTLEISMLKKNARARSLSPENVPQPVVLEPETIALAAGGVMKSRHEMSMSIIRNVGG
jgi:hypothetical protein